MKPKTRKSPRKHGPAAKPVKAKARGRTGSVAAPLFSWPIWESKKQAATVIGCDVAALTTLQKAGCPAFRHNRVYCLEMLTWVLTRGLDDPDIDWSRELKKQQAIAAKRNNQLQDRALVNLDEMIEDTQRVVSKLRSGQRQVFLNEFPPSLVGLDALQIQARMQKAIDSFDQQISEWAGKVAAMAQRPEDEEDAGTKSQS